MLQLVPSQCSTKVPEGLNPTAQTLFDAGAVTPVRLLPCRSLGLETTLQVVPFQCSINVFSVDLKGFTLPTAHTSLLAGPATPKKAAFPEGVETTLQLVPSKCSASVWSVVLPLTISPTAQMSLSAIIAAASREELLINGLGTTWRPVTSGLSVAAFATTPAANSITNPSV